MYESKFSYLIVFLILSLLLVLWLIIKQNRIIKRRITQQEKQSINVRQDFIYNSLLLIDLLSNKPSTPVYVLRQQVSTVYIATQRFAFFAQNNPVYSDKIETLKSSLITLFKLGARDSTKLNDLKKQLKNLIDTVSLENHYEKPLLDINSKKSFSEQNIIYSESVPEAIEDKLESLSMAIGFFFAGLIYTIIFLHLTWETALSLGVAPLDLILFEWLPENLNPDFFNPLLPEWSEQIVRPIVYAFALFYGLICITMSLFNLSPIFQNSIDFIIKIGGLLFGYSATIWLAGDLFQWFEITPSTHRMFIFKFGYILLAYYIFACIKSLLPLSNISRIKYDAFLDGLFALTSTFILIKIFDGEATAVLTGPIFLTISLLGFFIAEHTYGRFFIGLNEMESKLLENYHSMRGASFFQHIQYFLKVFWQSMKAYRGQNFLINSQNIKMLVLLKHKEFRKLLLPMSIFGFFQYLLSPLLFAALYVFFLEGLF